MFRVRNLLLALLAGVLIICGIYTLRILMPTTIPSARATLAVLDDNFPGRGIDLYQRTIVLDHAMAYALYASTAALLGDKQKTVKAADWLIANPAKRGIAGWGLPFKSDAFGDGSINSIDTIYGITTALAVRALLDAYDLTYDLKYRSAAKDALDYYRDFFTQTSVGGYFWYSDQNVDNIDAHNVSAMLMGQYARASVYFEDDSFAEIARKAYSHLLSARRVAPDGSLYWPYSVQKPNHPNDALHAAYIVQGILDYRKHLEEPINVDRELRHLSSFVDNNIVLEFPPSIKVDPKLQKRQARAWGVGMLIHTLSDAGRIDTARKAALALHAYQERENVFGLMPGQSELMPRIQTHISLGLARLEQM